MTKALILMADNGHDPTETTVPYHTFKDAGFTVSFATEHGKEPECDRRMLEGLTQRLLGATQAVVRQYAAMTESGEWKSPLSWRKQGFTLADFDLVCFPGGHDKTVRQIIDSVDVHRLLVEYFPMTKKPSKKVVGAVCHGVQVLSTARGSDGKSVIHECITTSLPGFFEGTAYWLTRPFLGDYYKTYGAGTANSEAYVIEALDDPAQYRGSTSISPFVVEDENYNYISARYPGDVALFAQKLVTLVQSL